MNTPGGLPQLLTSFVGRRAELADLSKLVTANRLVTIVGPGGAGKTRLATQLGYRLMERFNGRAIFVDLSALQLAGMVEAQVARAAEATEKAGRPLMDSLAQRLSGEFLLILDNCEHVAEEAAQVALQLLAGCPDLTILATSRRPLQVPGEVAWRIPPLTDAVQLFAERAASRSPGYQVGESTPVVAELCRRLDEMPLAVELASAWVGILGEAEILERVTRDLDLLGGGGIGTPDRHRTISATIEWSYKLLQERERTVFVTLGVFAGSFDLSAVEKVTGEPQALLALSALVSQSLVVAETRPNRPTAYRMLETIRQFAGRLLKQAPDSIVIHRRHAGHYLGVAEEAELERDKPVAREWMKRLSEDVNNLRGALEWMLGADPDGAVQLAGALGWYFQSTSSLEGSAWLDRALGNPTTPNRHRSRAADWAGWLEIRRMNMAGAQARLQEGLQISTAIGDKAGIARALTGLGPVARFAGKREESRQMVERALVLAREVADLRIEGGALTTLGILAFDDGETDRAADLLGQARLVHGRSGNISGMSMASVFLGAVKTRAGDHPQALAALREGLDGFESVSDTGSMAMAVELMAIVADHLESADRYRLAAACQAIIDREGMGRPPFWLSDLMQWREVIKRKLGRRADQLWAQGSSMTLEQAARLARGGAGQQIEPEGFGKLSKREKEVARLVAEGLSNLEIAQRLFISERTAESHVSSILSRMGFRSRAQVAAWVNSSVPSGAFFRTSPDVSPAPNS